MEISVKVLLILILATLCCSLNKVFAGIVKIDYLEQNSDIEAEISRALLQPTPWNYYFSSIPWSGAYYLNRSVDAGMVITDKQFSEVKKALRFSLPIYEDYVRKINSVRSLRQFLLEFPATPDICALGISFPFQNNDMLKKEHVGCLLFRSGIEVTHWTPQPNDLKHPRAENQRFLPSQIPELAALYNKGVPRRSVEPKPTIRPALKLVARSEETAQYHFFEFIKKWVPTFDLKLILMGTTDELKNRCCAFSFAATGTQKISLQKARIIAATCGKDSLQFLKTDQRCLEYFIDEPIQENPDRKPSQDYIAFRISFWDENIDRVVQPFIAEVRFVDSVFSYYTADEGQKLVLEHKETFDEAMHFLEQLEKPSEPSIQH